MSELERCDLEISEALHEETLAGLLWEMDWRSERVLILEADGRPEQHPRPLRD